MGRTVAVGLTLVASHAHAHSVELLRQTFETPVMPYIPNCGEGVDTRAMAQQHPPPKGRFMQRGRVETLLLRTQGYQNPSGAGAAAALALRSDGQSALAWIVDAEFSYHLNVGFSLSPIDVRGCGGPFGVTRPKVRISVYDAPDATFAFGDESMLKDRVEVQGTTSADPWTFSWSSALVSLASGDPTDGNIAIVFELVEGGYAVIDNLAIVGSHEEGDLGDGGFVQDPDGGTPGDASGDTGIVTVADAAAMDARVAPPVDAALSVEAGADAGVAKPTTDGCGCRLGRRGRTQPIALSVLVGVPLVLRLVRRRRAQAK